MLASEIMDAAAAILNDPSKNTYTYAAQLPYLRLAVRNLEGKLIVNGLPLFQEVSANIDYTANATTITLPSDLFLPIRIFEADRDTTDDNSWKLLSETTWDVNAEPDTRVLTKWNWREGQIYFLPAAQNREVRLHYIKSTIGTITDQTTDVAINRATNTLAFKTAEYISRYVKNNPSRADACKSDGFEEEDNLIGAEVKNNQHKVARRKPYGIRTIRRRPYITS